MDLTRMQDDYAPTKHLILPLHAFLANRAAMFFGLRKLSQSSQVVLLVSGNLTLYHITHQVRIALR